MEKSRNVEPSDFLWILSVVGDGVNPDLYGKLKKEIALLGSTFLFGYGALELALRFGGY